MDVLKELEKLDKDIQAAKKVFNDLLDKRINWCRENRKEIKKLYPRKGQIYQITNIKEAFRYGVYGLDLTDSVYFFKPTDIRFNPHKDFDTTFGYEKPTVKGFILDCNNQKIEFGERRIYITNLVKVNASREAKRLRKKFTEVYVMIDKNTGYYKIGRSINPKRREKTLQSEKPTIEMIFHYSAIVEDEKKLHNMFAGKRIRGEWFDLSGSDLEKIKNFFHKKTLTGNAGKGKTQEKEEES